MVTVRILPPFSFSIMSLAFIVKRPFGRAHFKANNKTVKRKNELFLFFFGG